MSIEFARAMKALAAGMSAAAFLFVQQSAADDLGINRFAVKNCTSAPVLVCAYDKTDSILAIPYDANRVAPGKKDRFSCGSANRCKVISVVSSKDAKRLLSVEQLKSLSAGSGVLGSAAGTGLGAMAWVATGAAGFLFLGAAVGAAAGVGGVIAVVKSIEGGKTGEKCKQALKDNKKAINSITDPQVKKIAQDSLKQKLEGSWPKYKDYSFVTESGVSVLVKGNKC